MAARQPGASEAMAHANTASAVGTASTAKSDGTLKSLKEGFGFIAPAMGGPNMFFHHSSLVDSDFNQLVVGGRVRYGVGHNDTGKCAIDVEILPAAQAGAMQ